MKKKEKKVKNEKKQEKKDTIFTWGQIFWRFMKFLRLFVDRYQERKIPSRHWLMLHFVMEIHSPHTFHSLDVYVLLWLLEGGRVFCNEMKIFDHKTSHPFNYSL